MRKIAIVAVSAQEAPWPLLLDADPSRAMVERYLYRGDCYTAQCSDCQATVGVIVLLRTSDDVIELMNIAVDDECQGKGIGKKLLAFAIEQAREAGVRVLEVGTGNSSEDVLAFYQKSGFRVTGVDRGFFVRNYPEPIVENGIPCVDMIRLVHSFSEFSMEPK